MPSSKLGCRLFAAAVIAVLGACSQDTPDLAKYDYRLAHPLGATPMTAVLVVEIPENPAGMRPSDARRLDVYARDYVLRGDGVLQLVIGADPGDEARARAFAETLVRRLADGAVPAGRIDAKIVTGGDVAPGSAVMRHRQWVANVPECGLWSESSTFDAENANAPNFGCATQRNIALMVANPRDLVEPTEIEPRIGEVGRRVQNLYRAGSVTNSYYLEREVTTDE